MSTKSLRWLLGLLAAIAIVGAFSGSDEPILPAIASSPLAPVLYSLHTGNSVLFALSAGYLNSLVFWIIVVAVPESRQRAVIRDGLTRSYLHFKRNTIGALVHASTLSDRQGLVEDLMDFRFFRDTFDVETFNSVEVRLHKSHERVHELLSELTLFAREIEHALHRMPVADDQTYRVLRITCYNVERLRALPDDELVEQLANEPWGTLACSNKITGDLDYDPTAKALKEL